MSKTEDGKIWKNMPLWVIIFIKQVTGGILMLKVINELSFNEIFLIGMAIIFIAVIFTGIISSIIIGHNIKRIVPCKEADLSKVRDIEKKLDGKLKSLAGEMDYDFKLDITDELHNYNNITQGEEKIVEEVLNEYLT